MTKWIEMGRHNPRPDDTLTAIEQEGFGIVCAVLDIEGEAVYHILNAVNAHDELLRALQRIAKETSAVLSRNRHERPTSLADIHACLIGVQIAARKAIAEAEEPHQAHCN